jgi:SAM-dependent methyltransferase
MSGRSASSEYLRQCYDAVAREYTRQFATELEHKPLDRELLTRFAGTGRHRGLILDLGCGPGQTTAFLAGQGAHVKGVDLSGGLLNEARRLNPTIEFLQGDIRALPFADGFAAGIVAFYAIVHFERDQLPQAFAEMHRVLEPGGRLLLSFHVGNGTVHVERFLDQPVALDFTFFDSGEIADALTGAGFVDVDVQVREPYPDVEYPTRRAYVRARRASG